MCIRNGSRGTNDIFSYKCICKVEEVIVVYCLKSISMIITACKYFVCESCLKGRYIQRILPIITNINNAIICSSIWQCCYCWCWFLQRVGLAYHSHQSGWRWCIFTIGGNFSLKQTFPQCGNNCTSRPTNAMERKKNHSLTFYHFQLIHQHQPVEITALVGQPNGEKTINVLTFNLNINLNLWI